MLYSRDTPFWSGTLDIYIYNVWELFIVTVSDLMNKSLLTHKKPPRTPTKTGELAEESLYFSKLEAGVKLCLFHLRPSVMSPWYTTGCSGTGDLARATQAKTTMMDKNNQKTQNSLFSHVLWAELSCNLHYFLLHNQMTSWQSISNEGHILRAKIVHVLI